MQSKDAIRGRLITYRAALGVPLRYARPGSGGAAIVAAIAFLSKIAEMASTAKLKLLAERWAEARAAERANAQSYIIELCDALEVEPPRPAGSHYEFELPIKLTNRDGTESQGFVDCYKKDHFVLEAKDYEPAEQSDVLLRRAFGQARLYASHDPSGIAPPYILVLDIGNVLMIWDRWSGGFGGFNAGRKVDLRVLAEHPDDIALLEDIWERPAIRDPRLHSQRVTKEIATHLAALAASLQSRGYEQERVARFLIRCVFTMFAEDVNLLRDEPFHRLLNDLAVPTPEEFVPATEELWRAMDKGERFGFRKLLQFNGHFFSAAEALPLTREDLAILLEASRADWSSVEPAIFGTLLTRALDPKERHRLGAEFTPPEFIQKVIGPTIEAPLREKWTAVQAAVLAELKKADSGSPDPKALQKRKKKAAKEAEKLLREFHDWLRTIRVLDPACGSGNFLYMALHTIKNIELEVLHSVSEVTDTLELRIQEVDPSQFSGIEIKPWAREIAELTLWVGFHQFWQQHHHVQPVEPLLRDTGTLECRDAVLTWDRMEIDVTRERPDPTPRLEDPVTGELVPDPAAKLVYQHFIHPRPAPWPRADFIVGNPPYLGKQKKRKDLGDGYVDAVQIAYPEIAPAADFVMLWWHRAASEVAAGRAIRAGLITTNSITQRQNRTVIEAASEQGARVVWAIPDHPWVSETDGAQVRVAMTVISADVGEATSTIVDKAGRVIRETRSEALNSDLTAGVDVVSAGQQPLIANKGLATVGFKPYGEGFVLTGEEAASLLSGNEGRRRFLRPLLNGRDLTTRARGVFLIDFGDLDRAEAERADPILYGIVESRVRPTREANPNRDIRDRWWQLGHLRIGLRRAMVGLDRLIVTPETTKNRFFQFIPTSYAPDGSLFCIASDSAAHLGVLSSRVHVLWVNASAGKLGVGNDARYNKACFDAFPFPELGAAACARIGTIAERIDQQRKDAIESHQEVTMTAIYNVLSKLNLRERLTGAERIVHDLAGCGVLHDLHSELDLTVGEAYGIQDLQDTTGILTMLVDLHDERVRHEQSGSVQWIRPDYQLATFGDLGDDILEQEERSVEAQASSRAWPSSPEAQLAAIRSIAMQAPVTAEEAAAQFQGAPTDLVAHHLMTLRLVGEVQDVGGERFAAFRA